MGVLLLGSVLAALPAEAQTFLPEPMDRAGLAFQLEKPFLPGSDGLDFYSSNLEVDAIVQLASGRSVQIGLPLSIAGADGLDGTSFFVGNLRASLLLGEPGELTGFVGVTIPTASNIAGPDLAVVVLALPWLHLPEKWGDDVFSVRGAWIPSQPLESGGRIGLRLGGAALVPDGFDNLHVFARAAGWGRLPVGGSGVDRRPGVDLRGQQRRRVRRAVHGLPRRGRPARGILRWSDAVPPRPDGRRCQ
jgi:hypothetical protein